MGVAANKALSAADFIAWSKGQQDGRRELVDGQVVLMSPETVRHALTKQAVIRAIDTGIRDAGLAACTVYPDGIGVVIDDVTVREPDASVQCAPSDPDSLTIDQPVIVVEVLSPASIATDTGSKLDEYFRIGSVRHYLVVDPFNRIIIHYGRDNADTSPGRAVYSDGEIDLTPPGIRMNVDTVFSEVAH